MLDDKALSRGFMVANNGLQIHGENTNDVVSTESFMMLKEHIVERYGRDPLHDRPRAARAARTS